MTENVSPQDGAAAPQHPPNWIPPHRESPGSHSEKLAGRVNMARSAEEALLRAQFEVSRQLHVIKWILAWMLIIVPIVATIGLVFLGIGIGSVGEDSGDTEPELPY